MENIDEHECLVCQDDSASSGSENESDFDIDDEDQTESEDSDFDSTQDVAAASAASAFSSPGPYHAETNKPPSAEAPFRLTQRSPDAEVRKSY